MSGELDVRRPVEEISSGWNRSVRSRVIQDVGRKRAGRGLFAAMVAVGVVLAGCGPGDNGGSTTTTTPVAEGPVNPWELPLEERPPLFDPCEEVSQQVVESAVGGSVEFVEELSNNQENELYSCAWSTGEMRVGLLSTWKSRADYSADRAYVIDDNIDFANRSGVGMRRAGESRQVGCYALFFTERGTVWLSVHMLNTIWEFQGARVSDSCDVMEDIHESIVVEFPEGDF